MEKGLISIIIPTYDRASLIGQTLDSVIVQTYDNWECIIVDDHSNDETVEIVKAYVEKDDRFKLYLRPESRIKGANTCRNFGFEKSKGEYINWFDSDDIMKPNFLKEKITMFSENLDVIFSYGAYFENSIFENNISKPLIKFTILDYVKGDFYLSTPGPLWKRSFLETKNLFDEKRQKIQDTEFHFRMLFTCLKYTFYEKDFLFYIRRGPDRISSSEKLTQRKLQDVLDYHYLTFLKKNEVPKYLRKEYVGITSKKLLSSFYEMLIYENSLGNRLKIYNINKTKIRQAIEASKSGVLDRVKIKCGIYSALILKRGYKLITE